MDFVMLVPKLGKALWSLKGMYDQHAHNKNEIKELLSFIQDYDQQIHALEARFKKVGGNVMAIAAFKTLEKDMMEATNKLGQRLGNESFFRVFNCAERMMKLSKLHSKVMESVQKSLGIVNLSMLLDMQATQATLVDSNTEMKSLLISSIGSMHGTLPSKVRDEVVEASISSFADPKFWEDILAAVDNHNGKLPSSEDMGMFEDPITAHLMIDPVVCSDGNTYCRWTIIDNNLNTNPLNVDEKLTIVIDNLAFRRGLFEKFPEQSQIFRQRRNEYRGHALSLAGQGLLGDAILALQYVLQWDQHDAECVESLAQVQRALQVAKEKYLQPSLRPSLELVSARPSGSKMEGGDDVSRIELDEAEARVDKLSCSIREVLRQRVKHFELGTNRRNMKRYYLDEITLLGLFKSLPKRRGLQDGHADVLECIGVVLKKGSSASCAKAASVLDDLFVRSSMDMGNLSVNSWTMHALVTSVGNGTAVAQEAVLGVLGRLCRVEQNKVRAIQAGVVPRLVRVIADQPLDVYSSVLNIAFPLVEELVKDAEVRRVCRLQAPASMWVDIIASKVQLWYFGNEAASVLHDLCADDLGYCQQARACGVLERMKTPDDSHPSVVRLLNLLRC